MRSGTSLLAIVLGAAGTIHAQAGQWGQCGGMSWTGPTTCVNGWICTFSNAWYSQCLPGSTTTAATTTTSINRVTSDSTRPTTRTTSSARVTVVVDCFSTFPCPSFTTTTSSKASSTAVITTSSSRTTSKTTAGTTPTGNYPGPTLLSGNIWIRAVAAPHFHEYLQTSAGTAVIASHTTAGQFQIVSGQLVQYTASGNLYANVEQRSDSSDMLLGVTFSTTQNTFGTFSWSGDALQWNVASINRPNSSAWYVCGSNNQLFINLGQYLYGTPSGCADQTIHFYNGATADL